VKKGGRSASRTKVDETTEGMRLGTNLSLVVSESLDLPLLLKGVDDVLVSPSDLVRQSLDGAIGRRTNERKREGQTSLSLSSFFSFEDHNLRIHRF